MKIEVYADGSGQTSNTDGGYGWVIVVDGVKHSEGSGHVSNATNNDMELEGAIQGLDAAIKLVFSPIDFLGKLEPVEIAPPEVILVSDSQIILGWADGSYRFKQESKLEKFKQLKYLMTKLNAGTRWVKGHSGDVHNTRCDKLANLARKRTTETLDNPSPLVHTNIGTKKNDILCVWHGDILKVIDLQNNLVEDYNREAHGKRGSHLEIREEKDR